jgi:hypothetical protein
MAVLEVCRRRLNTGIAPNDEGLKLALRVTREDVGTPYVYYSAMEEPEAFFQIGEWSSLEAYKGFETSSKRDRDLQSLNDLSTIEWIEQIPIDNIATLPLQAPVMTVSRCFFKEYDNHPQRYFQEVAALKPSIEAETKPWRYVGAWTVDTTDDHHKWIVFGGYRSKKHHQQFATKLKGECAFFEGMPKHYDEGTVHRHCWNMETVPSIEIFETLQGFIPQKITKAST